MQTPYSLTARTLVPGALAGVLSMLVLAVRGRTDARSALAPLNAPSHWVYGKPALRQADLSWRYTGAGLLIHHASALMWAFFFDRLLLRGDKAETPASLAAKAAAVTGTAALVDLKLVPERLTPGFEHHLSRKSLTFTYGAFAIGLALGALALSRSQSPEA